MNNIEFLEDDIYEQHKICAKKTILLTVSFFPATEEKNKQKVF